MRAASRGGASEIGVRRIELTDQPRDEIGGQEWRVGGDAGEVGTIRAMRGGPIKAGENAGERAGEAGYAVCCDRQRVVRKAGRITIRVEHERIYLRTQPLDDPVEQRDPTE